jgi:putative membrane protein
VVDATVETGGGEGAEAKLSVLSREEAERLRRAVFERVAVSKANAAQQLHPADAAPTDVVIRKLGLKDLALAGITSNHLLSGLALAGALWNFADDIIPDRFYRRVANYVYQNSDRFLVRDPKQALLVAGGGLLAVLVIGAIISVAGTILLFYGFTFSRRGDDLHRRYGLLTRRASSLPRRRIQVLEIEEKLLRRAFGLATLRADTSGSHREGEDDNEGRDVLLPIARRDEVDRLLPVFFPDFDEDRAEWRRASGLAIWRGAIKWGIVCLVFAVAVFAVRRNALALLPMALVPLGWLANAASFRHLGYALGQQYLQTRRGWLGRSTHIVPINKVQAVEVRQSPIDKRLGLASLRVDTAGQAYTEGGPKIENLPIEEANAIARALAQRASATKYRW